jgi:hypothetical protein
MADNVAEDAGDSSMASKTKTGKRKSKVDQLEESVSRRFNVFEEKFDKISSVLEKLLEKSSREQDAASGRREASSTEVFCREYDAAIGRHETTPTIEMSSREYDGAHGRRETQTTSHSPTRSVDISVCLDRDERRELLSDSEVSSSEVEDEGLSARTKSILLDLFGEDAKPKAQKKEGISLESSQKEILEVNLHAKYPDKLTAFQDCTKESFPLSEETDSFLNVPSLDPIIETLLCKKHGSKKSTFSKTGASLVSQPHKAVEKAAYSGQIAAKVGIASVIYMQKALGQLLSTLKDSSPNMDRAVQTVKDLFCMSQKSLDQFARTGAFHHVVRRKVAIADTGILDYLESSDLNLPLSSDGVFGKEFENLLQERKDRNKKIEELMPGLEKKPTKRKVTFDSSQYSKRFKSGSSRYDSFRSDSFRQDRKFGSSQRGVEEKGRYSQASSGFAKDGFKRPTFTAGRGGGKVNRK